MTAAYIYDPTSSDMDTEGENERLLGNSLDHLNRIVERISPEVSIQTVLKSPASGGIHSRRELLEYKKAVSQRGDGTGNARKKVISATVVADSLNDSAYETFYGDSSDEITPISSFSVKSETTIIEENRIKTSSVNKLSKTDNHSDQVVTSRSNVCGANSSDSFEWKQKCEVLPSESEQCKNANNEISDEIKDNVVCLADKDSELETKEGIVTGDSVIEHERISQIGEAVDEGPTDNNISQDCENNSKVTSDNLESLGEEANLRINSQSKKSNQESPSSNDPALSKICGSEWSPISASNGLLEIGKYTNEAEGPDVSDLSRNNLFSITAPKIVIPDMEAVVSDENNSCLKRESSIESAQFVREMSSLVEEGEYPSRLLEAGSPRRFQDSIVGNEERFLSPPPQAFLRNESNAAVGGQEDDGKSYFCLHCAYRACKKGQVRKLDI